MSEKKISKANTPSRLYVKDELHLKRTVKEHGFSDTRFKDNSAAVRHYVSLGIASEKRTNAANTLDDQIIKKSQKEVVTDSLLPLKNTLDELINAVENFDKRQSDHFGESRRQTDKILMKVETVGEKTAEQFDRILKHLFQTGRVSDESLRNSIILRSLMYVFLIGIKNGRVEPDDRTPWQNLVKFAQAKAKELSHKELNNILESNLDTQAVERLSEEMFTEMKRLKNQYPIRITAPE